MRRAVSLMLCVALSLLLFTDASAKPADDAETRTRVRVKMEIVACRSPEALLRILATGSIPTDADLAAYNKRHKGSQCAFVDSAELRVVREARVVTIKDTLGKILEVERLIDKRLWYVFST